MMRNTFVGVVGFFWCAAMVSAQSLAPVQAEQITASGDQATRSFDELRLRVRPGDAVRVVDASGRESRGRIMTVSDVALRLTVDGTPREFVPDAVRRVDRTRRDSVRNGLLIGAIAGASLGARIGRSADGSNCARSGIECGQGVLVGAVGGALWGAVGGWVTDALIRKREVIYVAPGSR